MTSVFLFMEMGLIINQILTISIRNSWKAIEEYQCGSRKIFHNTSNVALVESLHFRINDGSYVMLCKY